MNIFSKKTTITLDAFTTSEGMKMLNPIAPIREFYPKWLKELKPTGKTLHKEGGSIKSLFPDDGAEVEFSTIKKCPSMKDLYNTGFIIPLWSDVVIRTTPRGIEDVFYSYKDSPAPNFHSKDQLGPAFNNFLHIKINTPWIIKEKTGANFYFGSPFWSNIDLIEDMFFTPGIINYY
jgi:hypothetical protein